MTFEDFLEEWQDGNDFISAQTSGSTGLPKKIRLPKTFVKESALRTINFFGITKGSSLHSCVSPEFIGGKMMAVRADIAGCSFSWETPSNTPFNSLSRSATIDLAAVVPSQMDFVVNNLQTLPKIKTFLVGGSKIPDALRLRIAESGIEAYESYGMTETASHIALRKVSSTALPFTTLAGISVSTDSRGCISIRFADSRTVTTNDLAEIYSPTQFVILGRFDNIINSGGKKINPTELESRLQEIVDAPFMITGFPDEKWGERVVMIVEGSGGKNQCEELLCLCKKNLPGWQTPKEIIFVKELPKTPNGKFIRPKDPQDLFSFGS